MPHKARPTRAQYRRNAKKLLSVANLRCRWCAVPIYTQLPMGHPQKATADHVVPLSIYSGQGCDDITNLVPACWRCNTSRGNRNPSVLVPKVERRERSRDW